MTDPRVLRNRRAVHDAALQVLTTEGSAAVTVDRLAEVSGVSRSTIYRHWPDLGALIIEAFEEVVHESDEPLETDPSAALLAYLRDYARRLNDPRYASVLAAILEWSLRDPAFASIHERTFGGRRSRVSRVLQLCRKAGLLAQDVPMAQAVEDVVAPFLYRRLVLRREITDAQVRAHHARLLVRFGAASR